MLIAQEEAFYQSIHVCNITLIYQIEQKPVWDVIIAKDHMINNEK